MTLYLTENQLALHDQHKPGGGENLEQDTSSLLSPQWSMLSQRSDEGMQI